jgi:hypothetical protein
MSSAFRWVRLEGGPCGDHGVTNESDAAGARFMSPWIDALNNPCNQSWRALAIDLKST